jgi:glyoxylate/hydroxypyruvate reductase A
MKVVALCCSFNSTEWDEWLPHLQAALSPDFIGVKANEVAEPEKVEIALVGTPLPADIARFPNLRLVQSIWAGVEKVIPLLQPHVVLARMIDPVMTKAMCETALWAVLSLHRGFFQYAKQQVLHEWKQLEQKRAVDVVVVISGVGELGKAVAKCLDNMGYKVVAFGRGDALDASEADIVINLLPLTNATRGFFDMSRFSNCKRGVRFVNLARGASVVEQDLLSALDSGQVSHAVLDVFEIEPLPKDHPFWNHPLITVLPHIAARSDPRSVSRIAADNIRNPTLGLVNRERGY